jgi:hypothetical protein
VLDWVNETRRATRRGLQRSTRSGWRAPAASQLNPLPRRGRGRRARGEVQRERSDAWAGHPLAACSAHDGLGALGVAARRRCDRRDHVVDARHPRRGSYLGRAALLLSDAPGDHLARSGDVPDLLHDARADPGGPGRAVRGGAPRSRGARARGRARPRERAARHRARDADDRAASSVWHRGRARGPRSDRGRDPLARRGRGARGCARGGSRAHRGIRRAARGARVRRPGPPRAGARLGGRAGDPPRGRRAPRGTSVARIGGTGPGAHAHRAGR